MGRYLRSRTKRSFLFLLWDGDVAFRFGDSQMSLGRLKVVDKPQLSEITTRISEREAVNCFGVDAGEEVIGVVVTVIRPMAHRGVIDESR